MKAFRLLSKSIGRWSRQDGALRAPSSRLEAGSEPRNIFTVTNFWSGLPPHTIWWQSGTPPDFHYHHLPHTSQQDTTQTTLRKEPQFTRRTVAGINTQRCTAQGTYHKATGRYARNTAQRSAAHTSLLDGTTRATQRSTAPVASQDAMCTTLCKQCRTHVTGRRDATHTSLHNAVQCMCQLKFHHQKINNSAHLPVYGCNPLFHCHNTISRMSLLYCWILRVCQVAAHIFTHTASLAGSALLSGEGTTATLLAAHSQSHTSVSSATL